MKRISRLELLELSETNSAPIKPFASIEKKSLYEPVHADGSRPFNICPSKYQEDSSSKHLNKIEEPLNPDINTISP